MFPPGECSRAEGNGALGSFAGWDLLVLCGVGLLMGIVNSWVRGGRRGLPNYFGLSVLLGGLGLATLRFPTPSNFFFPPTLRSILYLLTGSPDFSPVEEGLFYENASSEPLTFKPVPQSNVLVF